MNPLILENHRFEAQLVQYGKHMDRYNLAFFKKYVLKICRKIRKWKNNSTCIIILYFKISQQKYENICYMLFLEINTIIQQITIIQTIHLTKKIISIIIQKFLNNLTHYKACANILYKQIQQIQSNKIILNDMQVHENGCIYNIR